MNLFRTRRASTRPFQGASAIIAGGSKGIGKAIAVEIVRLGGSVCLIARSEGPLQAAVAEIRPLATAPGQSVSAFACDAADMDALQPQIDAFVAVHGAPDYLFNCVGYAEPKYVRDYTIADFRKNMRANYEGQLVPILALLPHFVAAQKGHIINTSSILGFIGVAGYTAYTPTKYAIFGLSEALRNELKPYGIKVSVAFPPDTDTPGFKTENETKPRAVALLSSENNKLMSAEAVAKTIVAGAASGRFEIPAGDAGWMRPLSRLFPGIARRISDREYAKARQATGE